MGLNGMKLVKNSENKIKVVKIGLKLGKKGRKQIEAFKIG